MDSLELTLHRAFGVVYCIYGVKGLSEGFRLRSHAASPLRRLMEGSGGLLLLVSGSATVLAPHHATVGCVLAAPAIGLLALNAMFEKRTSEAVDLTLLLAVLLYLATS